MWAAVYECVRRHELVRGRVRGGHLGDQPGRAVNGKAFIPICEAKGPIVPANNRPTNIHTFLFSFRLLCKGIRVPEARQVIDNIQLLISIIYI